MEKTAFISPCGLYRYSLGRHWSEPLPSGRIGGARTALPLIMLNPSTADASLDDPTIRRAIGFAKREECTGVSVFNLFALRATNPDDLTRATDPFGPENDAAHDQLFKHAVAFDSAIVCAWGTKGGYLDADKRFIARAKAAGVRLLCFGRSKDGHPKHPLYLPSNSDMEDFL